MVIDLSFASRERGGGGAGESRVWAASRQCLSKYFSYVISISVLVLVSVLCQWGQVNYFGTTFCVFPLAVCACVCV